MIQRLVSERLGQPESRLSLTARVPSKWGPGRAWRSDPRDWAFVKLIIEKKSRKERSSNHASLEPWSVTACQSAAGPWGGPGQSRRTVSRQMLGRPAWAAGQWPVTGRDRLLRARYQGTVAAPWPDVPAIAPSRIRNPCPYRPDYPHGVEKMDLHL